MDDGIGYEDIQRAVFAGALVACAPGVRDGVPVVIVHAAAANQNQLHHILCPIGKVRAGFALGHLRSLWGELEQQGVELTGSVS